MYVDPEKFAARCDTSFRAFLCVFIVFCGFMIFRTFSFTPNGQKAEAERAVDLSVYQPNR